MGVVCVLALMDGSKDSSEVNYDDYPADAESESDSEGVTDDQLRVEGHKDSTELGLSDDVLCVVCAEILVEPCSLHCGHSFCQLCLATLWKSHRRKSPLYLHCPVCRQPWVNFPGINIQLRYVKIRKVKTG